MNVNRLGATFMISMMPSCTNLPTNCILDVRNPVDGNVALQLINGVLTTTLQSVKSVERRNCKGFNNIEKLPMLFVVVVDTMFPFPHCSCTAASAKRKKKLSFLKSKQKQNLSLQHWKKRKRKPKSYWTKKR